MSGVVYRVQGMTCGGCAKHVEKALKGAVSYTHLTLPTNREV